MGFHRLDGSGDDLVGDDELHADHGACHVGRPSDRNLDAHEGRVVRGESAVVAHAVVAGRVVLGGPALVGRCLPSDLHDLAGHRLLDDLVGPCVDERRAGVEDVPAVGVEASGPVEGGAEGRSGRRECEVLAAAHGSIGGCPDRVGRLAGRADQGAVDIDADQGEHGDRLGARSILPASSAEQMRTWSEMDRLNEERGHGR